MHMVDLIFVSMIFKLEKLNKEHQSCVVLMKVCLKRHNINMKFSGYSVITYYSKNEKIIIYGGTLIF